MGGGFLGKVLILSFEDEEEYIINHILSCINEKSNPPAMLGRME